MACMYYMKKYFRYGLYYTSKDWLQAYLGLPEESTLLRLLCGVLAGNIQPLKMSLFVRLTLPRLLGR